MGHVAAAQVKGRPAIEFAAELLRAEARPDDLVLVDNPAAVNRVRYYLMRAGADIRVVVSNRDYRGRRGHISHYAALDEGDFFDPDLVAPGKVVRLWTFASDAGSVRGLPEGSRLRGDAIVASDHRESYYLSALRRGPRDWRRA